jgi:hypothetical protein
VCIQYINQAKQHIVNHTAMRIVTKTVYSASQSAHDDSNVYNSTTRCHSVAALKVPSVQTCLMHTRTGKHSMCTITFDQAHDYV